MRRADRAQDRDFCLSVIDRCTHGVAALTTGEDTPYCLPLSFVRVGNSLYFHCAREGRKVELLKRCPRICITFVAQDDPNFEVPNNYTTYFQSAIVTGTVVLVEDDQEKIDGLRALCQKLTPQYMTEGLFNAAIQHSLSVTSVLRVDMDDLSGKAKKKR